MEQPWLADDAEAVRNAIATLLEQLRKSLIWNQDVEMAQRAQRRIDTGLAICRIPDDCIDEKRYPLFMAQILQVRSAKKSRKGWFKTNVNAGDNSPVGSALEQLALRIVEMRVLLLDSLHFSATALF